MRCGAVPTSERLETDLSEKTANLKAVFSEEINDDGEAEPENEPVRTVARGAAPTREKLETDLFEKMANLKATVSEEIDDDDEEAIASQGFDPDATRSGVFVTPASCSSSAAALPASGVGALTPTTCSAATALPVDGDGALTPTMSKEDAGAEASEADAALTAVVKKVDHTADAEISSASSSVSSASPVASSDEGEPVVDDDADSLVILNKLTNRFHLDAGEGRLRDGKPFPRKFVRMSAVPPGGRLCSKCF